MKLFETSRLFVRYLEAEDAESLFHLYSNPEVVRWMDDGKPLPFDDCVRWIEISQRNYQTKGFGNCAVIDKHSQEFIGCCGIVFAPDRNEPEIIYAFEPKEWGKGFASEVVPAMLEYGLNVCKLPRILATIASENLVSQHVAVKAGMKFERDEINPDQSITRVYSTNPMLDHL